MPVGSEDWIGRISDTMLMGILGDDNNGQERKGPIVLV
jgi:hypothetical protein